MHTLNFPVDSFSPCLVEIHAADRRHYVDPVGRQSKLRDHVWPDEVLHRDLEVAEWRAERSQCRHHCLRVLGRALYPDVEITRGARNSMNAERMRAHDQKAHVGVDKLAKQVVEIVDQPLSGLRGSLSRTSRTGISALL